MDTYLGSGGEGEKGRVSLETKTQEIEYIEGRGPSIKEGRR